MVRLRHALAAALALCLASPASSQDDARVVMLGASAQVPSAADSTGRLQILHNAVDPALAALGVYANGVRLSGPDGLAFRTGTPFVGVAAGAAVQVVVTSGASDTLAVAAYVAERGTDHLVVVEGGGQNVVARIFPNAGALLPGEPRIRLNIYNGAADGTPFGYDVFVNNGGGVFNFTASPGSRPQRFIVPVDEYNIRVRMAGFDDRVYTPADFQVPAGETSLFFSSGFRGSATAPLGLFVLTDDGAVVALPVGFVGAVPAPAPVAGLRVWPNPARSSVSISGGAPGSSAEALDVRGRRVWTGTLPPGVPLRVDVSGWPAGRYVVRARGAQTVVTVAR